MKKTFQLIQILQNLNRIKRTGGNLFMGIPATLNISIAEHSYAVTYLSMLFADMLDKKDKISMERLLRYCLIHDWSDLVLFDIPTGSPSYRSFWNIDIKKACSEAENNTLNAILQLIEKEVDIKKYKKTNLNELEKTIFRTADIAALLFEMLEWKYAGFKHEGWEMVWFNTIERLRKMDLSFAEKLAKEFNNAYKKGSKPANLFLAQPSKQVNPEHKL